MKILKSKQTTNQIQVITGAICLHISVIFNIYPSAFRSTLHKKLSTIIHLTLSVRTRTNFFCF